MFEAGQAAWEQGACSDGYGIMEPEDEGSKCLEAAPWDSQELCKSHFLDSFRKLTLSGRHSHSQPTGR